MKVLSSRPEVIQPIFVFGVPHSGTSWLGRAIDRHPSIVGAVETNYIWMWGNAQKPDDVLLASDLTPKIERHIKQRLIHHIGVSVERRLCDKTPRNCLRIPFLHALFPDAKFVFVARDGRAVVSSILRQNFTPSNKVIGKEILYRLKSVPLTDLHMYASRATWIWRRLIGKPIDYWGAKPPGWDLWVKDSNLSRAEVVAKQWAETTRLSIGYGRQLPSNSYTEVRYEDLMLNPQAELLRLANFLEIENPEQMLDLSSEIPDSTRVNHWQKNIDSQTLSNIRNIVEPVLTEFGYSW